MERKIAEFITHIRTERRLSEHTCQAYQRDIEMFYRYMENKLTAWSAVTVPEVRQFIAYRHRQGMGGKSIQRQLSSLRTFYQYLLRENFVEINPVIGIKAPKSKSKLPPVLDVDQMSRLLSVSEESRLAIRDLAIMELLYSSGLRLSELVALNVTDVDLTDLVVKVLGKGQKMRIIPVGRYAHQAINQWLNVRHFFTGEHECALFTSQRGTRLSHRSVQARLKRWGINQEVNGTVHPHRLRHSFASHLLESCGDIRAVQALLGHASISTTQIYTHLDFQHLAGVYDMAHPRAKKKNK